jgi:hypothetical protein
MTVTSEVVRTDYVGNGAVASYATTFPVKSTSEVRVFTQDADGYDVELTLGVDFTAVLNTAGLCTITLTAGNLADDYKLSLQRGIPYTQTYNPAQSGAYNAANLGVALDRLVMEVQRLKGEVDRSIKIPYLEAGGDSVTKLDDNATTRANQALVFDASGNAIVGGTVGVSASAFAQTLLDDTSADAMRTTLGIPSQAMAARTVVANDTAGVANGAATAIDDLTVLADGTTTRRTLGERSKEARNAKDYGVVGGGVVDDTAAIQAAVNAGKTHLPAGTYKVTARIVLPDGAFLIGDGPTRTIINSDIPGDSLFITTGASVTNVYIGHMRLNGNGLTGASGSGHCVNFIDPAIDSGTHTPQHCLLEHLYIDGFLGNDAVPNSVNDFEACAIIQADGLQNFYRNIIITDCAHGFFFYKAQNTKVDNCTVATVTKAALIAFDCENFSVDRCDFVDGADGAASANYPASSVTLGSALVISYENENFILCRSKLKNTRGGSLIRSILSDGDLIEGNWLRADSLTDNVHKGIYVERSAGVRIVGNLFSPANTAFSRKYQQVEIYTTQTAEPWAATISDNYFGNAPGMTTEYNIKVNGNSTTRRMAGISIVGNQFGYRAGSSSASVIEADVLFENCVIRSSRVERNVHFGGPNVTRTACIKRNSTATLDSGTIGLNHFEPGAGTITANYSGVVEPGTASADIGDASTSGETGVKNEVLVWNTPLTANRSVSLSTLGAINGSRFRIVRTAAATGASVLNVGTGPLKALAAGQWCDVQYDGSAWFLTAFGSL